MNQQQNRSCPRSSPPVPRAELSEWQSDFKSSNEQRLLYVRPCVICLSFVTASGRMFCNGLSRNYPMRYVCITRSNEVSLCIVTTDVLYSTILTLDMVSLHVLVSWWVSKKNPVSLGSSSFHPFP